ncbi:hypothetical protein FRC12_005007 [Ceratobasidium sp. 428]|nr:hypothetical protein FRC12_005007 [Ceratobasidium sp. 428]
MSVAPSDPATKDVHPQPKPRKLIICVDGTSNQFSEKNTNVVELYSRIKKDNTQLTYYNSGIGTYAKPFWLSYAYIKQRALNFMDLFIAWNFDKVVLGAYRWLADTYEPGDQVFLFGFSRGAYQVRTLAAMIEVVGLIHPGNQEQIPFAWDLYSNDDPSAKQFKKTFCRKHVDLHFVGVWDTVASVGLTNRPFPLTDKCDHITHFRHALALDERRVKFVPEHIKHKYDLVEDPTTEEPEDPTSGAVEWVSPEEEAKGNVSVKEVWFAGAHSDIGGGNKVNHTLDRGGEPLKWMMEEAEEAGLSLRLYDVKIGTPHAEVIESLTGLWWILEVWPFSWERYIFSDQLSASKKVSKLTWIPYSGRKWHLGHSRQVLPRQTIHWTVRASLDEQVREKIPNLGEPYVPKAAVLQEDGVSKEAIDAWDAEALDNTVEWEGDRDLTLMVELLKNEPELNDKNSEWLSDLYDYAKYGKPEAIWPYGGPQFLHRLMTRYHGDDKAIEITQLIVGFRDDIKSLLGYQPPSKTVDPESSLGAPRELSVEEQIDSVLIPRVRLLLKQWGAKYQEPSKPQTPQGLWATIVGYFSSLLKSAPELPPVDVYWNLDRIPKSDRSISLAYTLLGLASELAKLDHVQHKPDVFGNFALLTIALLPSLARPSKLTEREAGLAAAVLNSITAFKHESAMDVFSRNGITEKLEKLFDAAKVHSKLVVPTIRVVALVGHYSCAMNFSNEDHKTIPTLLELMTDENPSLANEAVAAIVVLSQRYDCSYVLASNHREQLFSLLEKKVCVDEVLQTLAYLAVHHGDMFSASDVDCLVGLMESNPDASLAVANAVIAKRDSLEEPIEKRVMQEALKLLTYPTERQVLPAINIIRAFVSRGKFLLELQQPGISSALATSLRSTLIRQELKSNVLDAVVELALKGSNTIYDDVLFGPLTALVEQGNIQATLALAAAAAYNKEDRTFIKKHVVKIAALIASDKYRLVKQAIQVFTILMEDGYKQEDVPTLVIIDAVISLIKTATGNSWYRGPGTFNESDETMLAAFELIEAASLDLNIRKHLIDTDVFGDMLAVMQGCGDRDVHEEAVKTLVKLKRYEDLDVEIERALAADVPVYD